MNAERDHKSSGVSQRPRHFTQLSRPRTHIDLLDELQLLRLDLRHEELHALLAVLGQQAARVLEHGRAALPAQRAQDDAEALRPARLHYVAPVVDTIGRKMHNITCVSGI
jgi:hypothetical protein